MAHLSVPMMYVCTVSIYGKRVPQARGSPLRKAHGASRPALCNARANGCRRCHHTTINLRPALERKKKGKGGGGESLGRRSSRQGAPSRHLPQYICTV